MTNWYRVLFIGVAIVVCAIPIFYHLGNSPLYMWDEATYACNSLDMYFSHNPVVVKFNGVTDWYNTKPPMVLWFQAISMGLFGLNEFAVRFPSALAAMLTVGLLLYFSFKVLRTFYPGIIASLVLVSSKGFIGQHGARSGDLDGVLVFWMTLYVFTYLKMLLQKQKIALHLAVVAAAMIGAFLSKGIAGFFFNPFLFLVTIVDKSFIFFFRRRETYVAAFSVLLCCSLYYIIREWIDPGYLNVVYNSEIKRYGNVVMTWHQQSFWFYLVNFATGRFFPFIYALIICILSLSLSLSLSFSLG